MKAILEFKGETTFPDGYCELTKPAPLKYSCVDEYGKNVCNISYKSGLPYDFCTSRCMNEGNFFTNYLQKFENAMNPEPKRPVLPKSAQAPIQFAQ